MILLVLFKDSRSQAAFNLAVERNSEELYKMKGFFIGRREQEQESHFQAKKWLSVSLFSLGSHQAGYLNSTDLIDCYCSPFLRGS